MTIQIAGIPLEILFKGGDMRARMLERYGAFAAPAAAGALRLEIEVDRDRVPAYHHPTFVDNPSVRAVGDLRQIRIEGDSFDAELDWARGAGLARIPDSLAHVDLFVRVALAGALLRMGDTLLHAAGVIRDRFGVVFFGPSGAGKSTIASICRDQGLAVLADELVVVRRVGAGSRLFGSPLWHGSNLSAPLGALLELRQAAAPAIARLRPEVAVSALLKAGGAPLDLPAFQEAFFSSCCGILRRGPAYRLEFLPDDSFWNPIDRLPEFAFFRPRVRSAVGSAPRPISARTPIKTGV